MSALPCGGYPVIALVTESPDVCTAIREAASAHGAIVHVLARDYYHQADWRVLLLAGPGRRPAGVVIDPEAAVEGGWEALLGAVLAAGVMAHVLAPAAKDGALDMWLAMALAPVKETC